MTVVLAFDEPLDLGWLGDEQARDRYWTVASGLHVAPVEVRHSGLQHGIQLDVTPAGARRLFGHPMAGLKADIVRLDDLLGPAAMEWHVLIAGQATWGLRFQRLDAMLLAIANRRGDTVGDVRPELAWTWTWLTHGGGAVAVADLAHDLGWSRRHLSTQFKQEFGLGPKQLARVARLQRARALLARGVSLSTVAAQSSYADQAHLTREWREMTGYTPKEWLREEFPFLQDADAPS